MTAFIWCVIAAVIMGIVAAVLTALDDPYLDAADSFAIFLGVSLALFMLVCIIFGVLAFFKAVDSQKISNLRTEITQPKTEQAGIVDLTPEEPAVKPPRPEQTFEFGPNNSFGQQVVEAGNFGGEK